MYIYIYIERHKDTTIPADRRSRAKRSAKTGAAGPCFSQQSILRQLLRAMLRKYPLFPECFSDARNSSRNTAHHPSTKMTLGARGGQGAASFKLFTTAGWPFEAFKAAMQLQKCKPRSHRNDMAPSKMSRPFCWFESYTSSIETFETSHTC